MAGAEITISREEAESTENLLDVLDDKVTELAPDTWASLDDRIAELV